MSPALDPGERLRRTERFISFLRLAIVVFNSILYLTLSPSQSRIGLAWTIIIVANLYALITVFWDPTQLDPKVMPVVNMVMDNVLIAVWLYATGGFSSPFYVLFYAEAAASVGRFGWMVGTTSAVGSALLYLAVILIDGGADAYQAATRIAYIFFITAFVAYVVENARAVERDAKVSEATAEAYSELTRLKAAFVSTISHELRTPLTTIKGATSTLIKNGERLDPNQMKTLLQLVERQSGHLGKLIQDLIDVATLEQGEIEFVFEWTELRRVVDAAVGRIQAKVPQSIDVRVEGEVERVKCDPVLIERVLYNLLDNASKFSSASDPISVVLSSEGGYMFIDVIDSGIGLEASEQESIFDRFYQVDSSLTRSVQGAGIGLNIARELARLHRGDIEVTSRLGEGARFRVSLPVDPESHSAIAKVSGKARARQSA